MINQIRDFTIGNIGNSKNNSAINSKVDFVAVGRGASGNPLIFQ